MVQVEMSRDIMKLPDEKGKKKRKLFLKSRIAKKRTTNKNDPGIEWREKWRKRLVNSQIVLSFIKEEVEPFFLFLGYLVPSSFFFNKHSVATPPTNKIKTLRRTNKTKRKKLPTK